MSKDVKRSYFPIQKMKTTDLQLIKSPEVQIRSSFSENMVFDIFTNFSLLSQLVYLMLIFSKSNLPSFEARVTK